MKTKAELTRLDWVMLIHQLPPRPTNLRVRIWRKLQKLGAVAIKNSVYVLPATEKAYEDLQWLKQEIESAGGEAAVLDGSSPARRTRRSGSFRRLVTRIGAIGVFDCVTGAIREQSRASIYPWSLASRG